MSSDYINDLERLKKLKDDGVLTEEEFEKQKKIILSNIQKPKENNQSNTSNQNVGISAQSKVNKPVKKSGGCAGIIIGIIFFFFIFFIISHSSKDSQSCSKVSDKLGGNIDTLKSKVSMGMSKDEVSRAIGNPDQKQEMNQDGMDLGSGVKVPGMKVEYWYYTSLSKQLQIGFENGRVNAINSF